MNTLEDAWNWYKESKEQHRLIQRLARNYWDDLPWEGKLDRDDHFKQADKDKILHSVTRGMEHLDDLAVLVLFSAFESLVRSRIEGQLRIVRNTIEHPVLGKALEEAIQRIEEGSFHWVLEPFKSKGEEFRKHIEEVNQVRRYRNWVAHGRRGKKPEAVSPAIARDRLNRLFELLIKMDASEPDPETATGVGPASV